MKRIMDSNKIVGLGLMALAVILFVAGFAYIRSAERALLQGHEISDQGTCTVHPAGSTCPFVELNKLAVPKYLGFFADIVLFGLGLFLFLRKKPGEKNLESARSSAKKLEGDEAQVFNLIMEAEGMIFQNELVDKTGFSKVKVTRSLDKLEGKGLIERRRRGMTNAIILK